MFIEFLLLLSFFFLFFLIIVSGTRDKYALLWINKSIFIVMKAFEVLRHEAIHNCFLRIALTDFFKTEEGFDRVLFSKTLDTALF